ncbi:MIP/aquaporin family protein [Thermalbibacter longus]|uniref:Aquaporin family protein n=2 Tax=Thermorudis TaxID=1649508 RepID=A0A831TBJ8_9BACT|nr:MIP/aquaporin family protein [Thermalbibacter longus]
MENLVAEIIGTLILILLGDGVVAGVLLARSKAQGGGWIVITTGWALAVAVAVYAVGRISGAHINPAVTIGLAAIGELPWADVPLYIIGQFIGAIVGAILVWLTYLPHWAETDDPDLKRAVFCTAPNIRNYPMNLVTEIIGTAMLLFGVLAILANEEVVNSGLGPFLVGALVWGIGLSLGGPTGYAINPARDLGPRIAHAILPIPGKGHSDWEYSWVPVVGPIIGGVLGALLFQVLLG